MNPHPNTIEYVATACSSPGMFMRDYDLTQLESQIHGYDSALLDAELMGHYERFNVAFSSFVGSKEGCSCSQGWALALVKEHGAGVAVFKAFLSLLSAALPNRFQDIESVHQ